MTHDTDELGCPRCGTPIPRPQDTPVSVGEDAQVRVETECPGCETVLEVVTEGAPDGSRGDVWVEDRRDNEN
jgi:endogenous inhibitor of DNA gyrase (YacG/DUF329 family)